MPSLRHRARGTWLVVLVFAALVSAARADGPPASAEVQHTSAVGVPASGAASSPPPASANDPRSVFFIQRNKNRNEVHYGVTLDENCRPSGDAPVHNFWLKLEKGPDVTEPVKLLQQAAYGFKSQKVSGDQVVVVLRAVPQRPVTFLAARERGRCSATAYMDVAGERARLERVYVFAEEGLFLPHVKYVDLFARREDGEPVHERLEPK